MKKVSHAKPIALSLALAVLALVGVFFIDAEFFNHALAGDAGGVFAAGEEKGNAIAELAKGKIAIVVTGLTIIVCGIMMQMGRLSHMIGVRIIIGAFLTGSAMDIAQFLYD